MTERINIISYFEVRQSLLVLFVRIFLWEILLTLVFIFLRAVYQSIFRTSIDNSTADFYIVFLLTQALNFLGIMLITVLWTGKFYRISADSVSASEGFLNRKTNIISMRTISSVNLKQSFFGRLFNYGVIRVECMFSKQVIYLKYITKPQFFRKAIQNLIAEAVQKTPIVEHLRLS
jgi:uncharacterized membrane protein YdbT with pleckstrin-like domain